MVVPAGLSRPGAHVLGPHAQAHQSGRQATQDRKPLHQPHDERHLHLAARRRQRRRDDRGSAGRPARPAWRAPETAGAPGRPRGRRPVSRPSRNGAARMFAAATASWMAMLMPTPPIGDMVCAAVADAQQRRAATSVSSRSTPTVSSLRSSIVLSSSTRSANDRHQPPDGGADLFDAVGAHLLGRTLGNDIGALPVVAAVEHHQDAADIETAHHLVRDRRPCG